MSDNLSEVSHSTQFTHNQLSSAKTSQFLQQQKQQAKQAATSSAPATKETVAKITQSEAAVSKQADA
jgi:hypothetical protein